MLNVACVVVTFNRKILLGECIQALLGQTYALKKIIIIDNNSTDGTDEMLSEKGFTNMQQVEYVRLPENIGGAGGFNKGLKHSFQDEFDWVWLMDDDTIPYENALEKLIESIDIISDEKIGFLCSKVCSADLKMMNVPNISLQPDESQYPIWPKYLEHGIVAVECATFVSILVPQKAIKAIGYPWKEFFIWGDDTEYTLRISRNFGIGYIIGKSQVIHKRSVSQVLSIYEEDNLNRIKFYKYMYRNHLIISSFYYNKKSTLSLLKKTFIESIMCLFKSKVHRTIKFMALQSALFEFLFKYELRKSFEKRMSMSIQNDKEVVGKINVKTQI